MPRPCRRRHRPGSNACGSAADLAGAYERLLAATGTNLLDVDIETGVDAAKVVDALSQVQRRRGTDITLTLPIDLGGLNVSDRSTVQLGFINITQRIEGVQLGFINLAENGFLPVFPFFNFPKN